MPRGTRKILYAWAVDRVNPGAGQDTNLENGGYKLDSAVAEFAYPDSSLGAYLASSSAAYAQALSSLRHYQSKGIDCTARVYYKIFGADATNPMRALLSGEDNETTVGQFDLPEYSVRRKVILANTENHDADIGDQLPQDIDNAVGG